MQFAYRANRSTKNAVNMALQFILQHLDSPGSYARMLFIDFSSAFNRSSQLCPRASSPSSTYRSSKGSSTLKWRNIGSPPGFVLSPQFFSLYGNSCTTSHESVKLLKLVEDTTLIEFISGGDESISIVHHLVSWCSQNNLEVNVIKIAEMVVDFRHNPVPPYNLS